MSLFSRLFHNQPKPQPSTELRFGRFSDAYKKEERYQNWDDALKAFEKHDYLQSFTLFFRYLRDEKQDNVKVWKVQGQLVFEILQGSKKLIGYANLQHFKAVVKIAKTHSMKIGFLSRLIGQNFNLRYGRYCIDEDGDIAIVFDTYTIDASPYKLYYALKEIGIKADKQDDLLVDEFAVLEPVNTGHIEELSEDQKEIKYQFVFNTLQLVLKPKNPLNLDAARHPGALAYQYLDAIYKIDYLTKAEGFIMESVERIHRSYFAADKQTQQQKNSRVKRDLQKIIKRTPEEIKKEFYHTYFTFGITAPASHQTLVSFLQGELKNMVWYTNQGYSLISLAIAGYIVGYNLFYYALPLPDKDLLHLYYCILEQEYFNQLGFHYEYYDNAKQSLNKNEIISAIKDIRDRHKDQYPGFKPVIKKLNFSSPDKFAYSYLSMLIPLDLSKKASNE